MDTPKRRASASAERQNDIKAHRAEWLANLPRDLRAQKAWAGYDADKIPVNLKRLLLSGKAYAIGNDDAENLVSFEDALHALNQYPDQCLGLAFAVASHHGIGCFDLDCPNKKYDELRAERKIPDPELAARRDKQAKVNKDIVEAFKLAGALIMFSQSGKGAHIFFRYSPPEGQKMPNGKLDFCGQLIAHSCYVYVTGQQVFQTFNAESELPDCTGVLVEVVNKLEAEDDFTKTKAVTGTNENGEKVEVEPSDKYGRKLDLTDEQVIEATKVRDKSEHDCYAILTKGKLVDTPKGTPSPSMAITHVISILDRISGDPEQIARIVMNSAVVRNSPNPVGSKETRAHKTHRLIPGILQAKRTGYDAYRADKERAALALALAGPRSVAISSAEAAHAAEIAASLAALKDDPNYTPPPPETTAAPETVEGDAPEAEVPVTYESVIEDIAKFTAEVAAAGQRVYPEALEPIVFKMALLSAERRLSPAKMTTLQRMLLGTGVVGLSDAGNGRGISDIRKMVADACLKILNERRTESWQGHLMRGDRGVPLANEENAVIAVDQMFGERLFYDLFTDEMMIDGQKMAEEHHMDVLTAIQRTAIPSAKPMQIRAAVKRCARRNAQDSLQSYLRGLKWDGKPRLNNWLVDLLGAPDTRYNRCIGRWFCIGAAARALRPGCQMDNMFVLGGGQGKFKSTAIRILSGGRNLEFSDDITTKDGQQKMRGQWMVEMSEMGALGRRDNKLIKAFQTRLSDKYRKAWDADDVVYPRQFVTVGTTNDEPFLRDATGERRYWIVDVGVIDRDALAANVDQIWAEAVLCFEADMKWWPEGDADQWFLNEQARVNDRWSMVDGWQPLIEDYLMSQNGGSAGGLPARKTKGASWLLENVLEKHKGQFTQIDMNRVGAIMTKLHYKAQTVSLNGQPISGYAWKGDEKDKWGWWVREVEG